MPKILQQICDSLSSPFKKSPASSRIKLEWAKENCSTVSILVHCKFGTPSRVFYRILGEFPGISKILGFHEHFEGLPGKILRLFLMRSLRYLHEIPLDGIIWFREKLSNGNEIYQKCLFPLSKKLKQWCLPSVGKVLHKLELPTHILPPWLLYKMKQQKKDKYKCK